MEIFSMTSATVLAMYMNMVSVNTSSNFAYNAEMQDGKVNAITVCENDGKYLHMQKKDVYTYDAQDRVVAKETFNWDEENMKWVPVQLVNYIYTEQSVEVELSRWNRNEMTYRQPQDRMVYDLIAQNVVGVSQYRWNMELNRYDLASGYVQMQTDLSKLLAQN